MRDRAGMIAIATARRRIDPADSASPPLEVAVAIVRLAGRTAAILIGADAIWFSDELAARLRAEFAERAAVSQAAIALTASHTHGSPQPDPRFAVGAYDAAWIERFAQAARDAFVEALAAPASPVELSIGRAAPSGRIAVNRRRVAWHWASGRLRRRAQNLPNPVRPIDERLTLIVARDEAGAARLVIAHFACHPVTAPRHLSSADYPGALRQRLRKALGDDLSVIFLQGHCGDVRPNFVHEPSGFKDRLVETLIGPRFRASRDGDIERFMSGIDPAIAAAISGAAPVVVSEIDAERRRLPVRLADGRSAERELDLTVWRLPPALSFVFASGEMLSGLAAADPDVLSVGYANGMVGYVAPTEEHSVGGYEIDGFAAKFGLPMRFAPETGVEFSVLRDQMLGRRS